VITLRLLNHASFLLSSSDRSEIRLLTDPWFDGHAFDEGWGLRWHNEHAFRDAATATHLWVSHFHDDHLHLPTLRELVRINPGIVFLANRSFNFDMVAAAQRLGFRNIIPIDERVETQIADGFSITRFPVTGIDNALLVKLSDLALLNYNDCVLSRLARRLLAKKIGKIDVFMSNFNHAGKLLHTKKTDSTAVKAMLKDNFSNTFREFEPKIVIPFASHHYYRAPESAGQNDSLLTVQELAPLDKRIVALSVGLDTGKRHAAHSRSNRPRPEPFAGRTDCGQGQLRRESPAGIRLAGGICAASDDPCR
jgi:hypothetical protein